MFTDGTLRCTNFFYVCKGRVKQFIVTDMSVVSSHFNSTNALLSIQNSSNEPIHACFQNVQIKSSYHCDIK